MTPLRSQAVLAAFIFVLCVGRINSQSLVSDFEDSISPWISDSASGSEWQLTVASEADAPFLPKPSEGNNIVLLVPPVGQDGSAVLWSPELRLPEGGTFSIDFWIRSKYFQSNNLEIYAGSERLLALTEYSTPYNIYWRTANTTIPAGLPQPLQINIRGFKSGLHEDNIAIDNIKILSAGPTTESTSAEPITTGNPGTTDVTNTTEPGTTENPGTTDVTNATEPGTTENPGTTDISNTTEPGTTGNPGTTDVTNTTGTKTTDGSSTVEPYTTDRATTEESNSSASTEEPQSTTASPDISTTEPTGNQQLVFDFTDGLQGWTLARQNGARWKRSTELPANGPSSGYPDGAILEVGWIDLYSGPTVAQSPFLIADINSIPTIQITFWIKGSFKRPAQLQLKRKVNDTFDEEPFANFDTFGQAENKDWITVTKVIPSSGTDPFQIVLYGFLGLDFANQILVDNVIVSGARLAYAQQRTTFTFEEGLQGWLPSNLDGGSWVPRKYNEVAGASQIPAPPSGESGVLFATAYVENAGIITIESPPITINATDSPLIAKITFWISDTSNQPGWLLVRKKTATGLYDMEPFIDSTPLGTSASQTWFVLQEQIPLGDETTFQLVVEAYLGGRTLGLIAIDRIEISRF